MVLSSIMVSNCPALHHINITSNSLQKLALQKQENLTSLDLQCQSLQEADLTDCESLKSSICEVFSVGGGCPMIKSLILDNCESLTDMRIHSTSLVSLSLLGCYEITALKLECPCLEQVCLDGCDHLEKASFFPISLQSCNIDEEAVGAAISNCSMLETLDVHFCPKICSKSMNMGRLCAACPSLKRIYNSILTS